MHGRYVYQCLRVTQKIESFLKSYRCHILYLEYNRSGCSEMFLKYEFANNKLSEILVELLF